jgi:outer membrane protein assembly factor BamB
VTTLARAARSGVLAIAAATLAVSAAGCVKQEQSNDGVNPDRPLWASRPNGAMSLFARRPLTAASRTVGEDYERGRAEIDVASGRLFVGSSDRGLYALRASNLSTIWRFETLGFVQSEPLYDHDLDYVYFGSHDGALYCVHASDGTLVYRFNSGAEVSRKPVISDETLLFSNAADNFFAIDRRTGKMRWTQHRTSALGMEISGHAGPALDGNGRVFMAYSDGHVVAYDIRDGNESWPQPVDLAGEAEAAAGGDAPRYLDVDTTPIVDDHPTGGRVVYVAGYAGGVFALSADNGAPVWKNERATGVGDLTMWREPAHMPSPDGPERGDPMIPERKILLGSSATTGLWALDPITGRMLWRVPIPEGGITAPVAVAGALVVGTTRYGLFLISPRNGKVIDGLDLGTGFSQTPAAYGNRVYTLTNGGTLVGLQVVPPFARK